MFMTTPDLSEARRLLAAGLKLVKLHPYTKQPIGIEWNQHSAASIDDDATGYGLPLAVNGLCSIDPDHVEMARVAMRAWGFDLEELLAAGVRTSSTRPDSGGRSAFLADPESMTRWLPFRVFDSSGNSLTFLELRAKSPNLQDVVPGIVYTNKEGNAHYSQQYANNHRFDAAPALPERFLAFWRELSTDDDKLREYTSKAVGAIAAAGFKMGSGDAPQYRPPMGGGVQLAFPAKGIRTDYNAATTVESILERHGYTYHENKQRWTHPGATGAPAIRQIPGKEGLWQSDHGGDALHGTFDAWAAHVQLDHGGDTERAIVEWMWKGEGTAMVPASPPEPAPASGLQELMDSLRVAEPEQAERIAPKVLQVMESLPELQRVNWHKQVRDVMHWNAAEFKAILKDLRRGWETTSSTSTNHGNFDPARYIYMPPRDAFYDTKSGLLINRMGLTNKYLTECENAPLIILRSGQAQADQLGWLPTGSAPPPRDRLIFEDEGKLLINTWRGFALSPMAGDVSPWLDHAKYLLPDDAERDAVINFMAALVQRVDKKPAFAVIHRGEPRNGKDSLYLPLSRAIGSAAKEANIEEVQGGDAWGDYRAQTKFLIITEVNRTQDRNLTNAMKTIVAPTATGKRTLNMKGGQVVTEVDCMGVLMMTNYRSGFAIEQDDQRYFVVDSWVSRQEPEYYQRLHDWYDKENGPAKVLHYLMQRDISGFNHNALPFVTKGAQEMAQSSRYDYEQDIEELILEGLPPFDKGAITAKELKAVCRNHSMKVGNNGLEGAMARLGWVKLRGQKKVDGGNKTTPTFFAKGVSESSSKAELYDLYHSLRLTQTILTAG